MSSQKDSYRRHPSRRAFVKALAAAPALPSLLISAPAPVMQQPPATAASPIVNALVEVVQARYGKLLSAGQLDEIKQGLERAARASERLRSFNLKNSDEPDFLFSAVTPPVNGKPR